MQWLYEMYQEQQKKKRRKKRAALLTTSSIHSIQMQFASIKTTFLAVHGSQIMILISNKSRTSHLGKESQTE